MSWHVTYDECNRCETVAYHRAKADGADESAARKQAAPEGRLWKAAPVKNP